MNFQTNFKHIILFLKLTGVYLGSPETNPKNLYQKISNKLYEIYCVITLILITILTGNKLQDNPNNNPYIFAGDYFYCAMFVEQPPALFLLEFFSFFIFLWTVIKYFYFLANSQKSQHLMSFWSNLEPKFCKELRKASSPLLNSLLDYFISERNSSIL